MLACNQGLFCCVSLTGTSVYSYERLVESVDRALDADPWASEQELATKLGVDRHTLTAALKDVRGVPYSLYRREKLLRRAEGLMSGGEVLSIKQMAYLLGFRSPQSFSRFIRRNMGVAPSQLMKRRGDGC